MQRRATMTRSSGSAARAKMNASVMLLVCFVVGSAVGYDARREAPYNLGPNDPYSVAVSPSYSQEPSQRLFWGTQGTNQVGGTGLWATLTNKFPFLGNMFGRMELPTEYGVPNQYDVPQQFASPTQFVPSQFSPNRYELSQQYGVPGYQQPQLNQVPQFNQQAIQQQPQLNQVPQFNQQVPQQQPQFNQVPQFNQQSLQQQPQYNQLPQFYQQAPQQSQQFGQRFVPSSRDVGLTDDAVIVTPPFVPISQPVPVPAPAPAPVPVFPAPAPQPSPGYNYNKPQIRLEYPRK